MWQCRDTFCADEETEAQSNSREKDIDHASVEQWQNIGGHVLKLTHGSLNSLRIVTSFILIYIHKYFC